MRKANGDDSVGFVVSRAGLPWVLPKVEEDVKQQLERVSLCLEIYCNLAELIVFSYIDG